jgi:hypothetical protein
MKIITGMHRSGTSLVARLFHEMGGDLGDPATFYRADKWNPNGYFEQNDVQAMNIALINGWLWKFAYFSLPSQHTLLRRAARQAADIHRLGEKYRGKIVKEARFCLTLPAWIAHGAPIERVVVCVRHPDSVARSLRRRNHIWLSLGHQLWAEHNRRLIDAIDQIDVWIVDYHRLSAPETFVAEVIPALHFMDLEAPDGRLRDFRDHVLAPSPNDVELSDDSLPEPTRWLWQIIIDKHRVQYDGARTQ